MSDVGVGLIGCGAVSGVYLDNAPRLDGVRILACADVDAERARVVAAERGLEACGVEELTTHEDVEVVLCLTPPDHHAAVGRQAIGAGRHFYTEKPLATSVADARGLLDAAEAAGVLVGCAPDTFLGAGVQTLREAIDSGRIGTPAVATIRLLHAPPERWHPSPAFLYAALAGPLLDVGPYTVSTAVELFGPVRQVAALATRVRETGTAVDGSSFEIAEPTRVSAVLEHAAGVLTTVTVTFDADGPARFGVEVHGSNGSLLGGDPNGFDGPVTLTRHGAPDEPLELVSEWRDNARGLGLQDLCRAVRDGAPQRASGALGLHVVEVLLAIRDATREGSVIAIADPSARGPSRSKDRSV
jgi:predicted dehydrogenase